MRERLRDAQGLTLTEVMVVLVLAAIIMSGLVAFYLNAQSVWFSGSSKVIAQREVSLVMKSISDRTRAARLALVTASPDADHSKLWLYPPLGVTNDSTYCYWYSSVDTLLHEGYPFPTLVDRGPMLGTKIERFQVSSTGTFMTIASLRVRTAQGDRVDMSTAAAVENHP